MADENKTYRLWYIVQTPRIPFYRETNSLPIALEVRGTLDDFMEHLLDNELIDDYINVAGIEKWSEEAGEYEEMDIDEIIHDMRMYYDGAYKSGEEDHDDES